MKKLCVHVFLMLNLLIPFSLYSAEKCSVDENDSITSMEEFLSYRTEPELVNVEEVGERRNYTKYLFTIKAENQDEEQVTKFYYYHTNRGPTTQKPTVILFSNVGGITILERYIGYYLAKKGISTVVAELQDIKTVNTLEKVSPYLVSSLFSSMNIVDFIAKQPFTDADKMATIGVSLGGFRALYLSALDMRMKSATLVVSGLSITDTIAHSTLEMVEDIRGEQMDSLGLNPEADKKDYEELLKEQIMFNIEDLLCRRESSDYLLFQSQNDTIVPYQQQEALYQALGQPKRTLSTRLGHKSTAVAFGLTKLGRTVDFLSSHW